jgi:hypothetical protein
MDVLLWRVREAWLPEITPLEVHLEVHPKAIQISAVVSHLQAQSITDLLVRMVIGIQHSMTEADTALCPHHRSEKTLVHLEEA